MLLFNSKPADLTVWATRSRYRWAFTVEAAAAAELANSWEMEGCLLSTDHTCKRSKICNIVNKCSIIQSNPLNESLDNGSIRLLVQVLASPSLDKMCRLMFQIQSLIQFLVSPDMEPLNKFDCRFCESSFGARLENVRSWIFMKPSCNYHAFPSKLSLTYAWNCS